MQKSKNHAEGRGFSLVRVFLRLEADAFVLHGAGRAQLAVGDQKGADGLQNAAQLCASMNAVGGGEGGCSGHGGSFSFDVSLNLLLAEVLRQGGGDHRRFRNAAMQHGKSVADTLLLDGSAGFGFLLPARAAFA